MSGDEQRLLALARALAPEQQRVRLEFAEFLAARGTPAETVERGAGNKTSLRWAACVNQNGYGLLAYSPESFNAGALHYTAQDLEVARHPVELIRRNETYLTLDFRHAGLGNASCRPGTLPQYVIQPEVGEYRLCLRPITMDADRKPKLFKWT